MDDEENRHCLVHVCLGKRESEEQKSSSYDSLRNFPMRLNMVEDNNPETSEFAIKTAIGLAVLHWEAMMDAMDTKFVIGRTTTRLIEKQRAYKKLGPPREVRRADFSNRATHL